MAGPHRSMARAQELYNSIMRQARAPVFHQSFGVPDTIDGRFDLLALHAFPILAVLESGDTEARKLGVRLADVIFAGFDQALRELGVGDFGIARRIKAMANAFYGRLTAYGSAVSQAALTEAVIRNLYRGESARAREAEAIASYIISAHRRLRDRPAALLEGNADFGSLPQL